MDYQSDITFGDVAQAMLDAPPALYSTIETKAFAGDGAAFLLEWAGVDVLLVSAQELRAFKDESESFKNFAASIGYDFNPSYTPQWLADDTAGYDEVLTHSILYPGISPAAAIALDLNGDKNVDICIITVNESFSRDTVIQGMTGVPVQNTRFTMTNEEMKFIVMAHEAAHCDDLNVSETGIRDPLEVLRDEAISDEFALDEFASRIASSDLERALTIRAEWHGLRAISAIKNSDVYHANGPFLADENLGTDRANIEEAFKAIDGVIWTLALYWDEVAALYPPGMSPSPYNNREIYKAMSVMSARGDFAGSALKQTYADQYLQAMEQYTTIPPKSRDDKAAPPQAEQEITAKRHLGPQASGNSPA